MISLIKVQNELLSRFFQQFKKKCDIFLKIHINRQDKVRFLLDFYHR